MCVCVSVIVCTRLHPASVQNLISVFKFRAQERPDAVLSDDPSDECLGIPLAR